MEILQRRQANRDIYPLEFGGYLRLITALKRAYGIEKADSNKDYMWSIGFSPAPVQIMLVK